MAYYEESTNSLPYIDDTLTDDNFRTDKCQYNLRIIENYQNKGRNIEITNTQFDDVTETSLSPVAPLGEEAELSDSQEDENIECKKNVTLGPTTLKLIIQGCNSKISIQSLDKKSSITFRRKSEKIRREKSVVVEAREPNYKTNSSNLIDAMKSSNKPKRGRWKMITRSLISKSSKFERRTSIERYPKYVLLKNDDEEEEEEHLVKKEPDESYPKMVIFNAKTLRKTGSSINEKPKKCTNKPEFSLKKSFKNKTEPVLPIEEILTKSTKPFDNQMKAIKIEEQEQNVREKRNTIFGKRVTEEKMWKEKQSKPQKNEQDILFDFTNHPVFQGNIFNEIQGILNEALNLSSDVQAPNQTKETKYTPKESQEYFSCSIPSQTCQLPSHNPPMYQSTMYIPVCNEYGQPKHSYRSFYTQTNENDFEVINENNSNLRFGILSSFFPGAVVMKAFQCESLDNQIEATCAPEEKIEINKIYTSHKSDTNTLKVPLPDLTIKSKMIIEEEKPNQEPEKVYSTVIQCQENLTQYQNSDCGDKETVKGDDDDETTECLYYNESESQENESITTALTINKTNKKEEEEEKPDNNSQNLSLTKVGYKMYDGLTKLFLSCEENSIEKTEEKEPGSVVNSTKKASFNISFESNGGVVKVIIPENKLIEFKESEKSEIEIGISRLRGVKDVNGKQLVQKNELWHPDNGRKSSDLLVVKKEKLDDDRKRKDSQKIKMSLNNNKEVVLSIEMNNEKTEKEKPMEKTTREMKIGTDDIDLAGGNLLCTKGSNYQNLSPRTGQILKSLEEKLAFGERERKILAEKIKKKLEDEILEKAMFPGLFLVKPISPRPCTSKSFQVPCLKPKKVSDKNHLNKLREYYCEECLATMRIFEDENPSVKSMVDKFETIIQLDKY